MSTPGPHAVPTTESQSWNSIRWLRTIETVAIPVYQREYRWSQATCEQLLADVVRVADAEGGATHFIGSVLAAAGSNGELTLVDGQQRITTLMLLLAAVRQHAAAVDSPVADEIAALVMRGADPRVPKLRPHERYEEVVGRLMRGVDTVAGDTAFEGNYLALVELTGADWQRVWRGLQRLEHVTIELGDRANAQQIFESLNSTGARLADDELIHNYIHMGRVHTEQIELERNTWLPIENATGGFLREFWRDYLIWSADEQPDMSGEFGVYRAFRRRYPDPRRQLTADTTSDWVKHAGWYGVLLEPAREHDDDVAAQLRMVRSFEGTPRPLLLGMYGDYAEQRTSKTTFIEAVEQLQTMLVRRALVNLERDLGMIGRLCRELREVGYPLERLVRLTPEDPQVRLALSHGSVPHVGYVLTRLQSPDEGLNDLQIEHIYPQTPRPDWSGDGGRTTWGDLDNDQQAEYRTVLNTLGNLTLLEAPLNQGAGNRPFRGKARYYAKSEVAETRSLADRELWNYETITERTKRMTEDFLRAWPRQSSAPMDPADELVRVVDLPREPVRGYPAMFEYAVFDGAIWGDVKTVKQLVVRLAHEFWTLDAVRLSEAEHGGFIRKEREPGKAHERLPSGLYLYTGWANQWLLSVAQGYIEAFDFHDRVKVKCVAPVDRTD